MDRDLWDRELAFLHRNLRLYLKQLGQPVDTESVFAS